MTSATSTSWEKELRTNICTNKDVRKAVLGYPREEDFSNDNIYLIGCILDFSLKRTLGYGNCNAAFFKDTLRNKAALGGLVPHQYPDWFLFDKYSKIIEIN